LRQATGDVSHHLPVVTCTTDAELAAVVVACPAFPETVRAGIAAMVKTALPKRGASRRPERLFGSVGNYQKHRNSVCSAKVPPEIRLLLEVRPDADPGPSVRVCSPVEERRQPEDGGAGTLGPVDPQDLR
jgi:hypothetical protein